MELLGKTALITGAGQGIGRAIAIKFGAEGANVAVNALHFSSAEAVVNEIKKFGKKSIAIEADVAEINDVDKMVDEVLREFGKIDILVNVAGSKSEFVPTIDQSVETFDRLVAAHLRGTYLCCRRVGQTMVNQKAGKVLNIASLVGITAFPMRTGYGAAKAGIINLTKTLAVEWAKYNINVNCIAPGYIWTPRIEEAAKESKHQDVEAIKKRTPLGRFGEPDDVAHAALFLVSKYAKFITGVTLPVDGGWLAYGYWA